MTIRQERKTTLSSLRRWHKVRKRGNYLLLRLLPTTSSLHLNCHKIHLGYMPNRMNVIFTATSRTCGEGGCGLTLLKINITFSLIVVSRHCLMCNINNFEVGQLYQLLICARVWVMHSRLFFML